MEKAEQHIQSEDIRNAPIFLDWNDICNADMKELGEMPQRRVEYGKLKQKAAK